MILFSNPEFYFQLYSRFRLFFRNYFWTNASLKKNKLRQGHLPVDITIFSKQLSLRPSRKHFPNEYIKTHVNLNKAAYQL